MTHTKPLLITAIVGSTLLPRMAAAASCPEVCDAVSEQQTYAVGFDDPVCLAACDGHTSCPAEWDSYFQCIDNGHPAEQCYTDYTAAKHCSVCDFGEGDREGSDVVMTVDNRNLALCSDTGTGIFPAPLCSFQEGIRRAVDEQEGGRSVKVFVCDGEHIQPADAVNNRVVQPNPNEKVIIESVSKGGAVVSGAPDWSTAFSPTTVSFDEPVSNLLEASAAIGAAPSWVRGGLTMVSAPVALPPACPGCDPFDSADGWRAEATSGVSSVRVIGQTFADLPGRITFSIYMRPAGWDRFRIDFAASGQGPYFDFELTDEADECTIFGHNGDGAGIEKVDGTEWYRVHFTARFTDSKPATAVRLWMVEGPSTHGDQFEFYGDPSFAVDLAGAQLDIRPSTEFATDPREYISAATGPMEKVFSRSRDALVSIHRPWPHDWGLASRWLSATAMLPVIDPIGRRAEMVFYDGAPLRQELSPQDMRPGSFWLDDGLHDLSDPASNHEPTLDPVPSTACANEEDCLFYVIPPDPSQVAWPAPIHIAESERLMYLTGARNWELRGLVFRGATGAADTPQTLTRLNTTAVALIDGENLVLVDNTFEHNNAIGVGVAGVGKASGIKLINNLVRDNGIGGETIVFAGGFEVSGEHVRGNNWRGAQGNLFGAITTGAKYARNDGGRIDNVVFEDNAANGLWLDFHNESITITNSLFADNLNAGIYLERNPAEPKTAIFVGENLILGNGEGIRGTVTPFAEVSDNVLHGNDVALNLNAVHENGVYVHDWSVDNNDIKASCSGDHYFAFGPQGAVSELAQLHGAGLFNGNSWTHAEGADERAFTLATGSGLANVSLADWMCTNPDPFYVPAALLAVLCPV